MRKGCCKSRAKLFSSKIIRISEKPNTGLTFIPHVISWPSIDMHFYWNIAFSIAFYYINLTTIKFLMIVEWTSEWLATELMQTNFVLKITKTTQMNEGNAVFSYQFMPNKLTTSTTFKTVYKFSLVFTNKTSSFQIYINCVKTRPREHCRANSILRQYDPRP